MTTTDSFRKLPEYYESIEECDQHKFIVVNTNPRYKFFQQTHFTAGDEEQFDKYRNKSDEKELTQIHTETFELPSLDPLFSKGNGMSVTNTFNYIFNKFKKGIFVQIRNGEVSVFLPFSKHNFINEWSHLIELNPKYESWESFFRYIYTREGRDFKPQRVNKFIDRWYANNALIRYEFPIHENDSGVAVVSDMFKELCKHCEVPDMEFFVNKRDFPLLRKNKSESYDFIFGDEQPLISHNYNNYAPILSMCSTTEHTDIPIPTWDDWGRVCSFENKFFPKLPNSSYSHMFDVKWENRKNEAIFRGSSTGFGTTEKDNMRLKVARMSQEDTTGLLNAGITKWNLRPRKIKNTPYFDTIHSDLPLVDFVGVEEQASYKYIINIDGHVSAYRLSMELSMGCCILLVQSKFRLWYSHLLKPWVHYVPVKEDCSDLLEQIQWCVNNDDRAREIAQNAREFYDKHLSKMGMLQYLQALLVNLKKHQGNYKYHSKDYFVQMDEFELDMIQHSHIHLETNENPPTYIRAHHNLQVMHNYMMHHSKLREYMTSSNSTQHNSKTNIQKYVFRDWEFMFKETTNNQESNHETFIGLHCVNSLLKYIPNFSYTFGKFENTVVTEYFNGQIFYDYLTSKQFRFDEYIAILLQVAYAIQHAQDQCLFTHYDLYPWNVMLHRLKNPVKVYYYINNRMYCVKTQLIPIIVDYGKSSCVYQNKFIGKLRPFQFESIHDILCLLISSMHVLMSKQTLDKKSCHNMFKLASFFSNTLLTNYQIFSKFKELKQFLSNSKKFSQMLNNNKGELKNKSCWDFIVWLSNEFSIPIQEVSEWESPMQMTDSFYNMNDGKALGKYDIVFELQTCKDETKCIQYLHQLRCMGENVQIPRKNIKIEYPDFEMRPYDASILENEEYRSEIREFYNQAPDITDVIDYDRVYLGNYKYTVNAKRRFVLEYNTRKNWIKN